MIRFPKEVVIHVLRDFFSQDSYYHYDKDEYGFANTPKQTNLPLNAGESPTDHSTTRLFIGEAFKSRPKFYPGILVKFNGTKEVPLSINKEEGTIQYEKTLFTDPTTGYQTTVHIPQYMIFAGVWEGSLTVEIFAEDPAARDEITELCSIALTQIYLKEMINIGVTIKPSISISAPSEQEQRNSYVFKQSITLDYRAEWRRLIPINNLIERIVFEIDFGNLDVTPPVLDPNIKIETDLDLADLTWSALFDPNGV